MLDMSNIFSLYDSHNLIGNAILQFKSYFSDNTAFEDYILETNNKAEILQKFAQINKLK